MSHPVSPQLGAFAVTLVPRDGQRGSYDSSHKRSRMPQRMCCDTLGDYSMTVSE